MWPENKKEKGDIKNFKKLIKFGFTHLSKSCTEVEANKFNSPHMQVQAIQLIKN